MRLPIANLSYQKEKYIIIYIVTAFFLFNSCDRQNTVNVISFYTAKDDLAHISFVKEANKWFPKMAKSHHFTYQSTNKWSKLNKKFLSDYQIVIFLDSRPEEKSQRAAFQHFMENGGGWLGFHFSAFALNHSDYPMNWSWYHNTFLGSGAYVSNTWRPTSATLRIEAPDSPITDGIPAKFKSVPNEWYRWSRDLRQNKDIQIIAAIDPSSFPLGTGPKPSEIWQKGYYPVVWTNKNYRMVYMNMGHNDMDYAHKISSDTVRTLSHTFGSETQNQLILNTLQWLGGK